MNTALKLDTLAAMPAMNAASNPVTATPSTPCGRYFAIRAGMAWLYSRLSPPLPIPGRSTRAAMPGSTVMSGTNVFG